MYTSNIRRVRIGVLDSGLGGLSVLRAIQERLPYLDTIYFADQAHLPYGPRPQEEIRSLVEQITTFLVDSGANIIVVACNSASAAVGLNYLRERFPNISIVGMEPAIKPAAELTKTGSIGALVTQATAKGYMYQQLLERYGKSVRIITQIAPRLVTIVEDGNKYQEESRRIIKEDLKPMLDAGVDQIVLGCTHYPFLMDVMQEITGSSVGLVDPSPAIARRVEQLLFTTGNSPIANGPSRFQYYTTGSARLFSLMATQLLSIPIEANSFANLDFS